jgi:hypothetical protein
MPQYATPMHRQVSVDSFFNYRSGGDYGEEEVEEERIRGGYVNPDDEEDYNNKMPSKPSGQLMRPISKKDLFDMFN